MHIVYASASCIPSRFANSINVMKMCQGFARLGHHVDLYAPNAGEFEQDVADLFSYYGVTQKFSVEKLPAPRYPSWPGRIVYASNYALRAWRRSSEIAYGRDWPALLMAAELGYDTILEMHAPAPKSGPKRLLFDRLAKSKHLLRIVVNSEALRDDFAESFPWTEHLLLLARNGADPIQRDPDRPLAIQRNGRMSVGYIGHLYPGRGMEILRDFAELCPWAAFHVVGGWPEDVAFWKQRIGDASNVTFHGHVAPSRVPDFLHAMDVLIAPYQPVVGLEGGAGDNSRWVCPLKVFDYMAAGKPIICSDHAVLREILTHEQDALLCRPTDVTQWADALRRLRDDHDLADALAARALESFEQQYSWDARARRVLEGLEIRGRS